MDKPFESMQAREIHVWNTDKSYPQCMPCNSRFLNGHSLRLHRVFYCPHHPTPEAITQRHIKEGEIYTYNYSDGEDYDADSVASDFHIDPQDALTHVHEPMKIHDALNIRD